MPEIWTVRKLLEWTTGFFTRKQIDGARLSAELLLAHVLQCPRIKLYTDYDRVLSEPQLKAYRELVSRAAEHEPIAYLTGKAHFFNLVFDVTRDVLIPRPDTETLVEDVLQMARTAPGFEAPRILDLCTGSGCIAAAIAHHLKSAVVVGIDISCKAVEIARRNIEQLKLADRVSFDVGNLYEPLARAVDQHPFQLIVANPPYIPTPQLPKLERSVRDFEPMAALDGGPDGLCIHRQILDGAPARLAPGGRVYLEIAFDQGETALGIARKRQAFASARLIKDAGGRDRVIVATLK